MSETQVSRVQESLERIDGKRGRMRYDPVKVMDLGTATALLQCTALPRDVKLNRCNRTTSLVLYRATLHSRFSWRLHAALSTTVRLHSSKQSHALSCTAERENAIRIFMTLDSDKTCVKQKGKNTRTFALFFLFIYTDLVCNFLKLNLFLRLYLEIIWRIIYWERYNVTSTALF